MDTPECVVCIDVNRILPQMCKRASLNISESLIQIIVLQKVKFWEPQLAVPPLRQ